MTVMAYEKVMKFIIPLTIVTKAKKLSKAKFKDDIPQTTEIILTFETLVLSNKV